jgi:tetratricopeptide (TPR) repeat protein
MRHVVLFFGLLIFIAPVRAQAVASGFDLSNYGVRIEPEKRVTMVLATLEMAQGAGGEKLINTPLSERSTEFRRQLLADNAGLNDDLRRRISSFVTQYKKRHPKLTDAETVAPFISMAYTLTPVPELADPVITGDLPGAVLDVLDFAPLVREFYRRGTISAKLEDYAKDYRAESDGVLRASTREMVSELLDYLHTRPRLFIVERTRIETSKDKSKKTRLRQVEARERERRFVIVPERLAARNNVNFLNIRDDYYVIVPPDTDLSASEARRAFLQFVIDPLILDYAKDIGTVRDWVKAELDERRKTYADISPDVFRAVTRSLVSAVDVRQAESVRSKIATEQAREKIARLRTDDEKRRLSADLEKFKQSLADEAALQLYEDFEKGSVLAFYFAEQLKGIEDSGFDIASSLKEMIASFDAAKEPNRVAGTAEARKRALAAREERRRNPEARTAAVENPVTTRLLEVQKLINAKDYAQAASDLKVLTEKYPAEPRIHYTIGRVAALAAVGVEDEDLLARQLRDAKTAYENVLRTATPSTDRALLSLTYVALARIYEHFNDNNYAIKLYDEAIKIDSVGGAGTREAMAGKQRLLKPQ